MNAIKLGEVMNLIARVGTSDCGEFLAGMNRERDRDGERDWGKGGRHGTLILTCSDERFGNHYDEDLLGGLPNVLDVFSRVKYFYRSWLGHPTWMVSLL